MPTKQIAWQTGSGNITLTYQGQGDGSISVQSDANDGNARSQIITIQTTKGGLITKNVTVSQAACSIPVGTILNYAYTGSYQEVTLPAGKYKLQCWGAQGGSNATASSYGITSKAGGKGGYSEGIITLSQATIFRVYVGGQGSSSAGGFNGGGSTSGASSYSTGTSDQDGYHFGTSRMGGGGGATDIRLSDGALLSRMIVAGGGSGGAMCYKKETTSRTVTTWEERSSGSGGTETKTYQLAKNRSIYTIKGFPAFTGADGTTAKIVCSGRTPDGGIWVDYNLNGSWVGSTITTDDTEFFLRGSNGYDTYDVNICFSGNVDTTASFVLYEKVTTTETETTTSNDYQVGFVGGGTSGGGNYPGTQSSAGSNGSFGQGANQTTTNYRYCSGAGGGGWYGGGGGKYSYSNMDTCKQSGGGSGFVNTSASAGNRPSGYTGLQLDSGTTYAGEQSFPAVDSGNETGHSGNGYARITRLYTDVTDFEYTGAVQSKTLSAGTYMIECWGAQGGSYSDTYHGGKGGYSVGKLTLKESTTVYVYVGGQGTGGTTKGEKAGGFNGGGLGYSTSTTYIECGGGGASDVRIGQDSLYARVIVAGGGGGAGSYNASYRYAGGAGGGVSGATSSQYSTSYRAGTGGTLTARGNSYYGSTANSTTYGTLADFGVGAGANSGTTYQITGGGGGWYGGGYSRRGAAGGGSGYVYNANTASDYPSGCLLNSDYYLADAETKAGNTSIPSTSYGTETGHEGNGYVRITRLS